MSGVLQQLTVGGAEQTVVTDLDEAGGEEMLEEAPDELLGADGAVLELVGGGLFISESDVPVFQLAWSPAAASLLTAAGAPPTNLGSWASCCKACHRTIGPVIR